MIGKGALSKIRSYWERQAEEAYGLSRWAAKNGSSTAYGTFSTANYWREEGAVLERRVHRAISLENRRHDREQERIKRERWEEMERTLRECYPTRIPEEWLK